MEKSWCLKHVVVLIVIGILSMVRVTEGIRFEIDREECLSHYVEYEGDTLHLSFVVIKADTPWHFTDDGVDLLIKGPSGEQIHDFRDKTSEKYEFVVQKKGVYSFCFTNKSPYHDTIDFDVHIAHLAYFDRHAKDEHFSPLMEQIAKLEEALYNIQFEQHWLDAQTDRQAIDPHLMEPTRPFFYAFANLTAVNEDMSRRALHKAMFESAFLIGASILQIYLLKNLFDRKRGLTRV